MTDLEITKLCAAAMGLDIIQCADASFYCDALLGGYDPLHDDAQMVALVKKLKLNTSYDDYSKVWDCTPSNDSEPHTENKDLNRAVVECGAKMQQAKS
jgi:hypothetical protein